MVNTPAEKVNAVFRKYLDPKNFTVVIAGDLASASEK